MNPVHLLGSQTHWGLMKTGYCFICSKKLLFPSTPECIIYWWVKHSSPRKICHETTVSSQGSLEATGQNKGHLMILILKHDFHLGNSIAEALTECLLHVEEREPTAVEPCLRRERCAGCFYTVDFVCLLGLVPLDE